MVGTKIEPGGTVRPVCPHAGEKCDSIHWCNFEIAPGVTCGAGPLAHGFLVGEDVICDNHGFSLAEDEVSDDAYWTEWEEPAEDCSECDITCWCMFQGIVSRAQYARYRMEQEENDVSMHTIEVEVTTTRTYHAPAKNANDALMFYVVGEVELVEDGPMEEQSDTAKVVEE